MATTKPVSGSVQKNDGATILHAGNIASSRFTNLSLATTNAGDEQYGSKVVEAVSPAESSNIGTLRPLSGGAFAQMETGEYLIRSYSTRIAQTTNNILLGGASDTNSRRALHFAKGNYRYDISAWDYVTGAATKGGNAGDLFTYFDPQNNTSIAQEPEPTDAVPGELAYKEPKYLPVQDNYKARTA